MMKLSKLLLGIVAVCAFVSDVSAQSSPGLTYGQVPTAGQWNSYFSAKQDVLGYMPLNQAGGTMLGPLKTTAPTTSTAGFSILPGVAPNVPNNGDIWLTSSGLYYRAGNITFGPIGAGTIAGPATTTVGNIAKWGNTNGTALIDGGPLGTAATQNIGTSGTTVPLLNGSNTWSAPQAFSSLTSSTPIPASSGGTGLLSVGTAISANTGTSGHTLPFLDGVNTWSAAQNLGTPSAITLTNGTSLPISTGVSGLGTGVATFLGTPNSANLATAVTDETGTGSLVFGTNPILATPNLGTPSAVNLTNATNLNLAAGVGATILPRANGGTGVANIQANMSGTFTPNLLFGGGSTGMTYSVRTGTYTRFGNLLYFNVFITLSAKGTSTGTATITGLPISAPTNYSVGAVQAVNMASWSGSVGVVNPGSTTINVWVSGASGNTQASDANFTSSTTILVQGVMDIGSLT